MVPFALGFAEIETAPSAAAVGGKEAETAVVAVEGLNVMGEFAVASTLIELAAGETLNGKKQKKGRELTSQMTSEALVRRIETLLPL